MKLVSGASLAMAALQSMCTAVLTISGIRLAIGLTAFVLAGTIFYTPMRWFHQDAIRIPMLTLATVGAIVDLLVLAWIWHLRAKPSAKWRRREQTSREKRSQRLQVALAILTLVLVGLETWTHSIMVRRAHAPIHAVVQSNTSPKG
jgi:formate hydrogenlyase subunit 3/multisubunit Na+/H+ antiporter MnhD subunit